VVGSELAESVVERIARAAHRPNRITLARPGKSLAETADMDVDGATIDFGHIAPNVVEQLCARKHPAGPCEEKLQQAEFYRR